jgi:hypothetical protein
MRFFLALLFFSPSLYAQQISVTNIKDKTCMATAHEVQAFSHQLNFPANWTIVVACGPLDWDNIQKRADAYKTNTGFTILENKLTIIYALNFQPRVLRHERGHIACNCNDEEKAEAYRP